MAALNDPFRREDMLKELVENSPIIEDENGSKQRIISIGGLYVDKKFFDIGKVLKNTMQMTLLDDDIILATCPKTGRY